MTMLFKPIANFIQKKRRQSLASLRGTSGPSIPKSLGLCIQGIHLDSIRNGSKTVEGRLNKPRLRSLCPGDFVTFDTPQKGLASVVCRVVSLCVYPSFREMLSAEGLKSCLPLARDLDEGVRIFHAFPRYRALEKQLGVLAIRVKREA